MKRGWLLAWMMILALGLGFATHGQSAPTYIGSLSGAFATLSVSGELTYAGELDWYTFDVAADETGVFFRIRTVGGSADLRMLVFEEDETHIASLESGDASITLDAGTYRVRVDSVDSEQVSYVLTIYNGAETEGNDGLTEANDVGEIAGPVLLSAALAPAGDADFYRFSIPASGLPLDANVLSIETFGASAGDTAMVLYRFDEGEGRYLPVTSDDDSGDGYWSRLLVQPTASERYALRVEETVYPLVGIAAYRLMLEPVFLIVDAEPNDTSATAVPLQPVGSETDQWASSGLLESVSDVDFYAITIAEECLIEIRTAAQGTLGDHDSYLTLYQPNGDRVADNDDTETDEWSRISTMLDPGDYFIAVEAGAYQEGFLPYQLEVITRRVQAVDEVEPNDADTESQEIDISTGAVLVNAVIGLDADIDAFRIVLDRETTLVCETGPEMGTSEAYDTTLAVYDEDLWEVAYNDDSNGTWSRIETTLEAGTYYLVVESYYGDETFGYTLLVTASSD